MAFWMAAMAAAGVGMSLLNAKREQAAHEVNIRREKRAAVYRAEDRRAKLRETLAAQRVAAVSQGSSADVGSNWNLRDISIEEFMTDAERDSFQTEGNIASLENAKISAILKGVSGASNSLLSYAKSSRETTGGTAKT